MMDFSSLLQNMSMGSALADALSTSTPDFNSLAALQEMQLQQNQVNATIAAQQQNAQLSQQQALQSQINTLVAQENLAQYKNAKISALNSLQTFSDKQADIATNSLKVNAENMEKAAVSDLSQGNQQSQQTAGGIQASFGAGNIISNTGSAATQISGAVDVTQKDAYGKFMQKFSQAQAYNTQAGASEASKAYSEFNTQQQIYFTNLMQ